MALSVNRVGPVIKVTGTTATDTEIVPESVGTFIKFVRWYNPSTSGHLCHIMDGMGGTIIQMNAEIANDTQMWPIYTYFRGIRCDDMDSGTLYIYIR